MSLKQGIAFEETAHKLVLLRRWHQPINQNLCASTRRLGTGGFHSDRVNLATLVGLPALRAHAGRVSSWHNVMYCPPLS